METLSQNTPEFPSNAKFVVYKFPGTKSTIQKTLLTDASKNRDWIKKDSPEYSYGFILKDDKYNELPDLYFMDVKDGKVKNIQDFTEDELFMTFEGNEAFNATSQMGLNTYIITRKIGEVLGFDPKTMKIV